MPTRAARRRAWLLVGLTLALALAAGRYGQGLRTDNRIESWAEAAGTDVGYELLLDQFGGDFLVLVRLTGFDAADPDTARWLDGLHHRLATMPGAARVLDGLHLPGLHGATVSERFAEFERRPLARAIGLGETAPARMDLFVIMHPDGGPDESLGFEQGFHSLRAEAAALGIGVAAAGHPFVAAELDRESKSIDRTFGPLLVAVGFVVCALFLRSWVLGLIALLPGIVGALGVRAGLRLIDLPSNMILVAAGPLVFVVMVASMVHLASAWRRAVLRGATPRDAARIAFAATWRPAAIAAATTAAGFGVFATSDVSAVRELGLTVACAVTLLVPLSYALMPVALAGMALPARQAAPAEARAATSGGGRSRRTAWRRIALRSARWRPLALASTAGVLAAGAIAPRGMPVAMSAVEYFRADHPIRAEYTRLDEGSAGLSGLDVLVHAKEGVEPAAARALSDALRHCHGVGAVFGPPAVLADLATLGPLAATLAPAVLLETGRRGKGGDWWRFTARASANTPKEIERLAADVGQVAAVWSSTYGYDVHVAGSVLRLFAMQEALVGTLAKSLALTALVALFSFMLCLRGARQITTAAVANLVPIAAVLAGARVLGYALDAATVMVASAVVGLALDNTFHIMLAAGEGGTGSRAARLRAFDRVGSAAVAGITILAIGFGCLALADFQPTARFGALAALGLLGALFADLVVIPALWIRPWRAGVAAAERGESTPACSTAS